MQEKDMSIEAAVQAAFAKPGPGEAAFEACGRTWVLKLGLNEVIALIDKLEYKGDEDDFLPTLLRVEIDKPRVMRTTVHLALLARHPEVTEEQAAEIVTAIGVERAGSLIVDALRWAMTTKAPAASPVQSE